MHHEYSEDPDLRIGRMEAAVEIAADREYHEERDRVRQARIARGLARARRRPSTTFIFPAITPSDADEWT